MLLLALGGLDEGGLADRPGDRAVRPGGDVVDPAPLGIGGDGPRLSPVAHRSQPTLPSSPPVTMRSPSPALARMPPRCTSDAARLAVRRHQQQRLLAEHEDRACRRGNARRPPARRRRPGACARRWKRSLAGVGHAGHAEDRSRAGSSRSPCGSCPRRRLRPMKTSAALALLAVVPRALVIAVEDHVHALEHEALGIVLERQDALGAQDARPVLGDQVLHPGKELVGIERLVGLAATAIACPRRDSASAPWLMVVAVIVIVHDRDRARDHGHDRDRGRARLAVSRNSGSMSRMRSRSKALRPSTSGSGDLRSARCGAAVA